MRYEFTIFKAGTTLHPVNILSKIGEPFDLNSKVAKYKYLGYEVSFLN